MAAPTLKADVAAPSAEGSLGPNPEVNGRPPTIRS